MQFSVSGAGRGHDEGLRVGYKLFGSWQRSGGILRCVAHFVYDAYDSIEHFLHNEGQKHNC